MSGILSARGTRRRSALHRLGLKKIGERYAIGILDYRCGTPGSGLPIFLHRDIAPTACHVSWCEGIKMLGWRDWCRSEGMSPAGPVRIMAFNRERRTLHLRIAVNNEYDASRQLCLAPSVFCDWLDLGNAETPASSTSHSQVSGFRARHRSLSLLLRSRLDPEQ